MNSENCPLDTCSKNKNKIEIAKRNKRWIQIDTKLTKIKPKGQI